MFQDDMDTEVVIVHNTNVCTTVAHRRMLLFEVSSHKLLCGQFLKQVLQRACALQLRNSESPSFFVKEFRFS